MHLITTVHTVDVGYQYCCAIRATPATLSHKPFIRLLPHFLRAFSRERLSFVPHALGLAGFQLLHQHAHRPHRLPPTITATRTRTRTRTHSTQYSYLHPHLHIHITVLSRTRADQITRFKRNGPGDPPNPGSPGLRFRTQQRSTSMCGPQFPVASSRASRTPCLAVKKQASTTGKAHVDRAIRRPALNKEIV